MKIILASIGGKHDENIRDIVLDYTSRINHYNTCEWLIIDSEEKFLKSLKDGDYFILLDERGLELNNIDLSRHIERIYNSGHKRLLFLIGGAYGVSGELMSIADLTISFSKLVFPHMLMRIMLAEQLYRTLTIIKGEKYHHI